MSPVGFEPTISAGEQAQTYDLDRGATGTGAYVYYNVESTTIKLDNWMINFSKRNR